MTSTFLLKIYLKYISKINLSLSEETIIYENCSLIIVFLQTNINSNCQSVMEPVVTNLVSEAAIHGLKTQSWPPCPVLTPWTRNVPWKITQSWFRNLRSGCFTFFAFVKLLVCRNCNRQRRCVWVFVVVVVVFCLFHFVCLASGTPCSWGCSVITVFLQPVTSCLNKDGPIWTLISWSGLCTFDQHLKKLKSCKIIKTKIEEIEILGRGEKFM